MGMWWIPSSTCQVFWTIWAVRFAHQGIHRPVSTTVGHYDYPKRVATFIWRYISPAPLAKLVSSHTFGVLKSGTQRGMLMASMVNQSVVVFFFVLSAGKAQPCREESHAGLLCSLDDSRLALGTWWYLFESCHVGPIWTPITSKNTKPKYRL